MCDLKKLVSSFVFTGVVKTTVPFLSYISIRVDIKQFNIGELPNENDLLFEKSIHESTEFFVDVQDPL